MTSEHRAKISAAKMGHSVSAETRAKIAASLIGRKPSAATRVKLTAAKIGHIVTAVTREKLSTSHKGKSHATWKSPKPFTAEHRARLSSSHLGHVPSEEARANMAAAQRGHVSAMRGKKHTPEARAKISAAHLWRRNSVEARARMSKSAIKASEEGRQTLPKSRSYTKLAQSLHRYLSSRGFTVEPEVRFGRYTVDLYDRAHHIAFEADGTYWHGKNEAARPGYHANRDEYLHTRYGLPVMRYSDTEIRYLEQ